MCGIAGIFSSALDADEQANRLRAMTRSLVHRGPDDEGHWQDPECGLALGHRRLAIIDLSPAGAQPMLSACGRHAVAFNGEIYNFRQLRAQLENEGVAFRGRSDTEVLVEGIARWGLEATLERIDGMFAFAAWNRSKRELSLARDRLGEKPLYYGMFGASLVFGSELKAILAAGFGKPLVNRDALTLLLRHNYIPEPFSIYQDVFKLPAGGFLTHKEGARALSSPRRYWSIPEVIKQGRETPLLGRPEEGVALLEDALLRSVEDRMVSDVPLGAFLSGGIDSSTVVALMQARSSRRVKTFSIGFAEPDYDEAAHARAVAEHLGTDHTELYVTPDEARAVIPQISDIYDEPFADSSQIPTYLVSRLARKEVTVAMSGDAGDELFGGYSRYALTSRLWHQQGRWPAPVRSLAATGLRALTPATWNAIFRALYPITPARYRQVQAGDKLHKLARVLETRDPMQIYLRLLSLWQDPGSVVIGAREPSNILDLLQGLPGTLSQEEKMMALDTMHYLPDDILVKVDRASMAVSLETRVPMLAREVVELAWRMPIDWKIRGRQGKWVLRQVLAKYVPSTLFERPKMGFGVPIDGWLRGPLRAWAEDLLSESRLSRGGYFDPAPIRLAWQQHLGGAQNMQYLLWGVLCFEAWRDRWGY
jgi:asparagine synthase (glutamine-hydrolysing)